MQYCRLRVDVDPRIVPPKYSLRLACDRDPHGLKIEFGIHSFLDKSNENIGVLKAIVLSKEKR